MKLRFYGQNEESPDPGALWQGIVQYPRARAAAHTRIPTHRGRRPLGMVDAHTHVEHLVTDESAATHRHSGSYLALCGAQVLAASLTAAARAYCPRCKS